MADKLVLLSTYASEHTVDWAILSDSKRIGKVSYHISVDNIDDSLKGCDTYVIFPSNHVSLMHTSLPSISSQKLQNAVPFALEENIAGDISDCEFIILSNALRKQHIAVIDKNTLRQQLSAFTENGISVKYYVPDVLCLPISDGEWSMLITGDEILLRTNEFSGSSAEPQHFKYFMEQVIHSEPSPNAIHVYRTEDALTEFSHADIPCHQHAVKDKLTLLAPALEKAEQINCLSAEFDWRNKTRKTQLLQKFAAGCIGLCLFGYSLSGISQKSHLSNVAAQYQAAIQDIYADFFPKATDVIAPKIRISRELNRLRESSSGGRLRVLLQDISTILLAQPSIETQELQYTDNSLRIKLKASSFRDIDNVVKALKKQGIRAKSQNAKTQNDKVSAELHISGDA